MQFQLTEWTQAVLATKTDRTEHHGEEKVPAVTLGFRITGPNTILDLFGKPYDFRHALYMAPDDGQAQIEGVDNTPLLRTVGLGVIPLALKKLEGWTLHIDHGIDEHDPIALGNCSVSKFKLDAFQGGSCELSFIVSTDDIDAEYGGLLLMMLGQQVPIRLIAPDPKVDAIDGTGAEFNAEHPLLDAADAFADNEAAGLNKDASEVPEKPKRRGNANRPSLEVQD